MRDRDEFAMGSEAPALAAVTESPEMPAAYDRPLTPREKRQQEKLEKQAEAIRKRH